MSVRKYLTQAISFHLSRLIAGRKNYEQWRERNYSLRKVSLPPTKLTQELEEACSERGGILTIAEYLMIEQFGTYGYHNTHKNNGKTNVHTYIAKPLALYCQREEITHIIEYGAGDGTLGGATLTAAQKNGYRLNWTGIELLERLHQKIRHNFQKAKLETQCHGISTIDRNLTIPEKSIIVLPYILDNIPPLVFVARTHSGVADTLLGVTITNNELIETLLTDEQL